MKRTKKIALSGISTALATIFLVFGNYIPLLDYSFYLLSSLCLTIPFATKEVKWGLLSFAVSTILGMIFVPNLMVMFSFFAFFGPYAMLAGIMRLKKVKNFLQYIIKGVFFALSIFLMYQFTTLFVEIGTLGSFTVPLPLLFFLAFGAMYVYDFLMTRIIGQLEKTVLRFMSKY